MGQVQPGWVRISLEGGSWRESGCRVVGERHGNPRLPHSSDCKTEPAFQVSIQRPSECHSREGHRDLTVEASAELDYNGFWVSVSGIVNKILELVEVVVDCPFALKIGGCLQDVNGSGF